MLSNSTYPNLHHRDRAVSKFSWIESNRDGLADDGLHTLYSTLGYP